MKYKREAQQIKWFAAINDFEIFSIIIREFNH